MMVALQEMTGGRVILLRQVSQKGSTQLDPKQLETSSSVKEVTLTDTQECPVKSSKHWVKTAAKHSEPQTIISSTLKLCIFNSFWRVQLLYGMKSISPRKHILMKVQMNKFLGFNKNQCLLTFHSRHFPFPVMMAMHSSEVSQTYLWWQMLLNIS